MRVGGRVRGRVRLGLRVRVRGRVLVAGQHLGSAAAHACDGLLALCDPGLVRVRG